MEGILGVAAEEVVAQGRVGAAVAAGTLLDAGAVVVDALAVAVVDLEVLLAEGGVTFQAALSAVDDDLHALVGGVGGQGVGHDSALGVLDVDGHGVLNVDDVGEQAAVTDVAVHLPWSLYILASMPFSSVSMFR